MATSVNLEQDIEQFIEKQIDSGIFRNKSHGIEYLLRKGIEKEGSK